MNEKILIAINDADLASSIEYILSNKGYSTLIIQDGNKVIESLKSYLPDLLIIDIVLKNKSGYDILSEKSFDRFITKIPTLIVSNSGNVVEMKKIPSTPTIKNFIVKSHIESEEIINMIEKILGVDNIDKNKEHMVNNFGKKILWVEDDKLLSLILSKKISNVGFTLLKALNEEETIKILENEIPDLMVFDILLPGINGLDLLQKIKTNPKFRKIPSIILSNMSSQEDIEKSKILGVNKFIVKAAVSLDEIITEIESILAK